MGSLDSGANSNHRHVTTLYFLQTLNFALLLICIFYVAYKSNIREIWLAGNEGRKCAIDQQNAGVTRLRRHISNNEVNQDDRMKYDKVMEDGIKFEGYPIDPFNVPNNQCQYEKDKFKIIYMPYGMHFYVPKTSQNEWSNFVNKCLSLKNFCTSSTFFNANKDRQNENIVELKGTVTSIDGNSPNTVQDQAVAQDDGESSNDVATVVPMQEQNMNKYHHVDNKNSKSTENVNVVVPLKNKDKFRKRKKCFIDKIGLPLEIGHRKVFYGTWMRDGKPRRDTDADKRFVMEHFSGIMLHEYASLTELSHQPDATPTRTVQLPHMYDGTSHAMYGGALYYHRAGLPNIVR
uniref:Olfactomedin-like domain-containing protein n=1 Tax=Romanomermis culicivorax TaxID=13658 RepID=A0A915IVH1_ROMCU